MSELTFAHRNIKAAISLNSCLADYTSAYFAYLSEQHQPVLEMKVKVFQDEWSYCKNWISHLY